MASATKHLRLGASAVGLALLAGCAQSPPTQFFTLDALASAAPVRGAAGRPIRIDHVTIPAVMDRPEMVREHAAAQLKVDDFSHWGAPLGDLMRATLVEDLAGRLPAGRVLPAGLPKLDGAADIAVEVNAIHERPGSIALDVDWTLIGRPPGGGGQGATVRVARHESIEAPLDGQSEQAFANALSQATATLADRIAVAIDVN